jgi:hypothetical protein
MDNMWVGQIQLDETLVAVPIDPLSTSDDRNISKPFEAETQEHAMLILGHMLGLPPQREPYGGGDWRNSLPAPATEEAPGEPENSDTLLGLIAEAVDTFGNNYGRLTAATVLATLLIQTLERAGDERKGPMPRVIELEESHTGATVRVEFKKNGTK